jgi:hypothetical protein
MLRDENDPKEARMRIASLAAMALLSIGVLAAYAQSDDERYTLEKSANGYVRMDKQTGEMSICQEQSGQLVCKLAADERSAFEGEVDRLQSSVEALENASPRWRRTRNPICRPTRTSTNPSTPCSASCAASSTS